MSTRLARSVAAATLALQVAAAGGCAAISRNVVGSVPPAGAVAAVKEGATVGEVLTRLGAPVEYWLAPDGLMLIWRERHYGYDRLELDPSQGFSYLSVDPIVGAVLANLKLVLERGSLREERVAVLFDEDGRVIAVAQRDAEGRRLR